MNKQQLLKHLQNEVYCRLRPAKYGIGIFAIKKIPKGTDPFPGCDTNEVILVDPKEIEHVDTNVKKMVKDFCAMEDGKYCVPDFGLNLMNISFYLNHSDNPNITTEDGWTFYTKRDIEVDEELTVDYQQYYPEIIHEFKDEVDGKL